MKKSKNYVGTKIGKFEILEQYVENQIVYLKTKCTLCGKIAWVAQKHVATRKCCEKDTSTQFKALDINNKIFNGITVLEKTDTKKRHEILWKCKCFCGNIFIATASDIKTGNVKSCGCYKHSISQEARKKGFEAYSKKYLVDNTNLSTISNKMISTNKSGYKGVFYDKSRHMYKATLEFQKTRILNKRFDTLDEAIKARKEAKEKYFKPILDKYSKVD